MGRKEKRELFILSIIIFIITLSFLISIYSYPKIQGQMTTHWNIKGEPDNQMPKQYGLFLIPITLLFLFLLFIIIPRIDPLKHNIIKFRKYYNTFIVLILLFLLYIHTLIIVWNIHPGFSMNKMLIPGLSILLYYTGVLIENARRNWFVGIRTPWTLSSDVVWNKTHKIGGKLFKTISIIVLFGVFVQNSVIIMMILILIILTTIYLFIYSYLEYERIKEKPQRKR